MKLMEYEAKAIFTENGIPVPCGVVIRSPAELEASLSKLPSEFVLKAQVDVGSRGKAGGILMAGQATGTAKAAELFARDIRGIPVREILAEEKLSIIHEYYASIAVDRSTKCALLLFTEEGGVDIEALARERPGAVRRAALPLLMSRIPSFMERDLVGRAPKEVGGILQKLYQVFLRKDAMLAEINPLVTTPQGLFAADAKLIIDDNALKRQGIVQNRDLSAREREAEKYGFSYVELDGTIGVIGNGAGLTMATLDLIGFYGGKAANFLDVGGGADMERVEHAVRLVAGVPSVKVIIVNLLGGITRCDEVARGIIEAGVGQTIIVRLAGTNEAEGKALLAERGYRMLDSMEEAVRAAVEVAK
jgi:succinyl-CoA synthetase beta subunit